MRIKISILLVAVNLLVFHKAYSQNELQEYRPDCSILTDTVYDEAKYLTYFFRVDTAILKLDSDDYIDTIYWDQLFLMQKDSKKVFPEMGNRITISNNKGTIIHSNFDGWTTDHIDTLLPKQGALDFILIHKIGVVSLNFDTKGLLLEKVQYASDPLTFTLITINSNNKPKIITEKFLYLVGVKDLDNDGYSELICKEGDYSQVRFEDYVPNIVYKYVNDTLQIQPKLTYNINYKDKKYRKYPQASITKLELGDIENLSKSELRIMRNEIFADYGYVFESTDLKEYFESQSWYKPKKKNFNIILTDLERKNIELIKSMENN